MWGRLATRAVGAALLALGLAGCAALPWPSGPARPGEGVPTGDYHDLRGAVHVHTRASHDSPGELGDLIDAAHGAGLAFVALTEHARHARFRPAHGTVEGVILVPGWELGTAGGGSILALGIEYRRGMPREPRALVEAIHTRGGAAYVGHLESSPLASPDLYAAVAPDGVEIVNLHASALESRFALALGSLFLPACLAQRPLLRPPAGNLAVLAQLPARGLVGGVDAHAKFRLLGPLGGTFDRYRDLFRLVTTHVLARERTPRGIVEALRAGRSYVAFEGLGLVDRFVAERGPEGVRVEAPGEALLALVCAGARVAEAHGAAALLVPPPDAERCHVEAWLGDRLWIISSPF